MHRETASTTTVVDERPIVSERYADDIAADIEAIDLPADLAAEVQPEQPALFTREDLEFLSQNGVSITDLYGTSEPEVSPAPTAPQRRFGFHAIQSFLRTDRTATPSIESRAEAEIAAYRERTTAEVAPRSVSEETRRGLGARALDFTRNLGQNVRTGYFYGMATVLGAIPTTKSRAEILELNQQQKEKYADNADHGFVTRRVLNPLRRNKYEIAAWTPTALMGAIAVGYALRATNLLETAIGDGTASHEIVNMAVATDIQVGGHWQGDPVKSGYIDSLKQAGIYDPNHKNVPINWSAQMAPLGQDQLSMKQSDAEGAAKIVQAVNDAHGGPVRITSFSQGTVATQNALEKLAAENGGRVPGNVEVILIGSPLGENGIGANQGAAVANPVLDAIGWQTKGNFPPGTRVTLRTDIADPIGNGGKQSLLKLGEMGLGPGHRVVGPENSVLISKYEKDGVTYEIWGDKDGINDPLLRLARERGIPVTREAQALAEAALPTTMPGQQTQYANPDKVLQAVGPAIDSYTGNSGIGSKTVDAVVANNPAASKDLGTVLKLQSVPDKISETIQHPETAAKNVPEILNSGTDALNTGLSYLQNPNKGVDMINSGLQANGIPPVVPHFEQVQQVINQVAPRATTPAAEQVGVTTTPLPAVNNPASIVPAAQAAVNQGLGLFSNFLGGATRR